MCGNRNLTPFAIKQHKKFKDIPWKTIISLKCFCCSTCVTSCERKALRKKRKRRRRTQEFRPITNSQNSWIVESFIVMGFYLPCSRWINISFLFFIQIFSLEFKNLRIGVCERAFKLQRIEVNDIHSNNPKKKPVWKRKIAIHYKHMLSLCAQIDFEQSMQ